MSLPNLQKNITETQTIEQIKTYYHTNESKLGYDLLLGGTKHFGYYLPRESRWKFRKSMRRMERLLAVSLNVSSGQLILDAGCGKGQVSREIARLTNANIIGMDLLEFNIFTARIKANKNKLGHLLNYRVGNYNITGLPDESVDRVYTMETLVHSPDLSETLKEFYRILKPGGRVVFIEYDRDSDEKIPSNIAERFKLINQLAGMPAFQYHMIDNGLSELMKQNGYSNVTVTDLTEHVHPMLSAFHTVGVVPYTIVQRTRWRDTHVNTISGVETWKYRNHMRYHLVTALKH